MNKFGTKSQNVLSTIDVRLGRAAQCVLKIRDFAVLSGARYAEEQNELFVEGVSKKRWPDSKHNRDADGIILQRGSGRRAGAIDIAPWNTEQRVQIPWEDHKAFIHLAGAFEMACADEGIAVRWGGNWDMDEIIMDDQTFQDLGHFEIVGEIQ